MPTNNSLKIKTNLYERTRRLFLARPRSLTMEKISQDTGIQKRWLDQFSTGRVKLAAVDRVEALYVYLSGEPLNLV